MKHITEIVIPAQPERVEKKEILTCDICTKKAVDKCVLCQRDVCMFCREHDKYDYGDYPDTYCTHCYKLKFEKYDKNYSDIDAERDKNKEDLDNKVKEESLLTK